MLSKAKKAKKLSFGALSALGKGKNGEKNTIMYVYSEINNHKHE